MKRTFVVLTLAVGFVKGYSQGLVYMGDYGNTDFQITIWSPQIANPSVSLQGNSSTAFTASITGTSDLPPGTQDGYTGTPLGGSATGPVAPTDYTNAALWSVQLYAAPGVNQPVTALSPVAGTVANFYPNPSLFGFVGTWKSSAVVAISTNTTGGLSPTGQAIAPFGVAGGSPATLAIAAWYNGNGAYTNFNAAVAAGAPVGFSTTGSENLPLSSSPPSDLPAGITSFSLADGSLTSESEFAAPSVGVQYSSGGPLLTLSRTPGSNFVVQYNTNLQPLTWSNLLSLTNLSSGSYMFLDPSAAGQPARFYRVFMQ